MGSLQRATSLYIRSSDHGSSDSFGILERKYAPKGGGHAEVYLESQWLLSIKYGLLKGDSGMLF